jgi:hypothetical protein
VVIDGITELAERKMYFLCIGHSHLGALKYRYQGGRANSEFGNLELAFLDLHSFTNHEYYNNKPECLGEPMVTAIEAVVAERQGPPAAVFFSIGGSQQHSLSLLNHEKPFDLVVPWDPEAPLTEDAQIVPFHLMEKFFAEICEWKLRMLDLLASYFSCPKYFFASPPPVADEAYLRQYPGPAFKSLMEVNGVSPLHFRVKIAAMHARLYKARCAVNGVTYLEAPSKALDEIGCLALDARSQDSIHANIHYGESLIEQIDGIKATLQGVAA